MRDQSMTDTDFTPAISLEEVERRARAMRAEVARDIFVSFGRGLRRVVSAVFGAGRKSAHA